MSTCNTDCTELVAIPGPRGLRGEDGTDGSDGINAFTLTTAAFDMPAEGDDVPVFVEENGWAGVGQLIFITNAGTFRVVSKTGTTEFLLLNVADSATGAYAENATPGIEISSGQQVSPTGSQGTSGIVPGGALLAVNNLSDVADPAASRSNIGIGSIGTQDAGSVAITGGSITALTTLSVAPAAKVATFDGLSPLTTKGDLLTHDGSDNIRRAVGASANMVPLSDGVGDWSWSLISALLDATTSQLTHQVASGGVAQAIAYGAWTTMTINTIASDPAGNVVSLAANQFTLQAGTYVAIGFAQPEQCYCRFRLRNVTGSSTLSQGVQLRTLNNSAGILPLLGFFTVAAAQLLEWQYWATNDGGGAATFGYPMTTGDVEIYKSLLLIKIA